MRVDERVRVIRAAVDADRFFYSQHAAERAAKGGMERWQVVDIVLNGEVE